MPDRRASKINKLFCILLLAYYRDFGVGAVCNLHGIKRSP